MLTDDVPWDAAAFTQALWSCEDLPDARLYRRLRRIVRGLFGRARDRTARPREAARRGATRFANNPRVDAAALAAAPTARLDAALATLPMLVVANDTTEIDVHGRGEGADAGPLRSNASRGYLVHAAIAVDPRDGKPIGLLDALTWTRSWRLRQQDHATRSYARKESRKWARLRRRVARRLHAAGITADVWFVEDREGDVYENLVAAARRRERLVVRATQDRALTTGDVRLWAAVAAQPVAATWTLDVVETVAGVRRVRTATVQLQWRKVTLQPPRRPAGGPRLKPQRVTAVRVAEVDAPRDRTPLEWLLVTTADVYKLDDALRVVHAYRCRWGCELFFDLLKNACDVEAWAVDDLASFDRVLAIAGPVAAQIARWTYAARHTPHQPAADVVDDTTLDDLKEACRYYRLALPRRRWTLGDLVRRLALLGGWEARPGRHPGWRTVLRGWETFTTFQGILHHTRAQARAGPRRPQRGPPTPR